MNKFIAACTIARSTHPRIWKHYGKRARRSLVRYWLPGVQLNLNLPWNA